MTHHQSNGFFFCMPLATDYYRIHEIKCDFWQPARFVQKTSRYRLNLANFSEEKKFTQASQKCIPQAPSVCVTVCVGSIGTTTSTAKTSQLQQVASLFANDDNR